MKKGDFIKIDFTGTITETGTIFDTTLKEKSKDVMAEPDTEFKPKTVCVGEGHILEGLDKELEKHKVGDSFTLTLPPEQAFGKKSAKFIQLISTAKFKSQGVAPQPGLQVNIDNMVGLIKNVSGGRTLVDFNHPLSGKEVTYEVKILEQIEDKLEQTKELLELLMGIKGAKANYTDDTKKTVKVTLPQMMPEPLQKAVSDKAEGLINIKVEFAIENMSKDSKKQTA